MSLLSTFKPTWVIIGLALVILAQSVVILAKNHTINDLQNKYAACQAYQQIQNEKVMELNRAGKAQESLRARLDKESANIQAKADKSIQRARNKLYSTNCEQAVKQGIDDILQDQ